MLMYIVIVAKEKRKC